jgi:hypothetical protein
MEIETEDDSSEQFSCECLIDFKPDEDIVYSDEFFAFDYKVFDFIIKILW